MKAARFFSICEIVCFVGLALSYAGEFLCAFVAQGTDKDIFQMGLFLFWLLIGPLAICNLICAATGGCPTRRCGRRCGAASLQ